MIGEIKRSKMKERSRHSPFPVPRKNHVVMGVGCFVLVLCAGTSIWTDEAGA